MRFNKKTRKQGVIKRMATFVEYAMLVGLMAILVAVGVAKFGKQLVALFTGAGTQVDNVEGMVEGATIENPSEP